MEHIDEMLQMHGKITSSLGLPTIPHRLPGYQRRRQAIDVNKEQTYINETYPRLTHEQRTIYDEVARYTVRSHDIRRGPSERYWINTWVFSLGCRLREPVKHTRSMHSRPDCNPWVTFACALPPQVSLPVSSQMDVQHTIRFECL